LKLTNAGERNKRHAAKDTSPLTIRIDPELRERVQRETEGNRRTIRAEIMALVDAALAARGASNAMVSNAGS
jgi:hypothetical protein